MRRSLWTILVTVPTHTSRGSIRSTASSFIPVRKPWFGTSWEQERTWVNACIPMCNLRQNTMHNLTNKKKNPHSLRMKTYFVKELYRGCNWTCFSEVVKPFEREFGVPCRAVSDSLAKMAKFNSEMQSDQITLQKREEKHLLGVWDQCCWFHRSRLGRWRERLNGSRTSLTHQQPQNHQSRSLGTRLPTPERDNQFQVKNTSLWCFCPTQHLSPTKKNDKTSILPFLQ